MKCWYHVKFHAPHSRRYNVTENSPFLLLWAAVRDTDHCIQATSRCPELRSDSSLTPWERERDLMCMWDDLCSLSDRWERGIMGSSCLQMCSKCVHVHASHTCRLQPRWPCTWSLDHTESSACVPCDRSVCADLSWTPERRRHHVIGANPFI